jgi:hypothetical protein
VGGPFRFHGSTAGKYRWRYPTTLAAMELLGAAIFWTPPSADALGSLKTRTFPRAQKHA